MKTKQNKSIGLTVEMPKEKCDDKHCPFHASFPLRGRTHIGEVVRAGVNKTVAVAWTRLFYIPKYQRYEKRISKVFAHLTPCMADQIKLGDKVKIVESRPISKTKNFVVVEKMK